MAASASEGGSGSGGSGRKIYGRLNSLNVQKVLWLCEELHVQYERIDAGATPAHSFELNGKNPKYLELNPNGLVPTLEEEGLVLWESNAIMRYLASTHAQASPTIYPADPKKRAVVDQWLDWVFGIANSVAAPFKAEVRGEKFDPQQIEKDVATTNKLLLVWENALAQAAKGGEAQYILGDFTLADVAVAPWAYRWLKLKYDRPPLPHTTNWLRLMSTREAFVHASEHLFS